MLKGHVVSGVGSVGLGDPFGVSRWMLDVSFLDNEDTDVIKSIQFVSLIQSFKTDKTALCAWKS